LFVRDGTNVVELFFPEAPMNGEITRRQALGSLAALVGGGLGLNPARQARAAMSPELKRTVTRALDWVARSQAKLGYWDATGYRIPMTALAGVALLCEGSTTTQGKYSENIRRSTEYLMRQCRENGLIGIAEDHRYTYGHGFSMLFLSQVLGEEEDSDRRKRLVDVLTRAAKFSGEAQTRPGGWGYVSSRDGGGFDEGSTTVTQVQGLRGCRNAGIKVPKDIIDKAIEYIYSCQMSDGGICYSSQSRGGSRPAITAAAIATLFNAGEYEGDRVKKLIDYCKRNLYNLSGESTYGHWHYTYYYYTQALYRLGGKDWDDYRDRLYRRLSSEQASDGSWTGYIGPIYVTSLNLTMLQMENAYLPIYQR
jgi:prenyltransferase beta subunit